MELQADQLTPGHVGLPVTIKDDGFAAHGIITGVVAYGVHASVVIHIKSGGSTATIMTPYNADVTVYDVDEPTSGIRVEAP